MNKYLKWLVIGPKLMKLVKLIKVSKPLLMLGSMSLSAIAYSFMLGPWLAIGLVFMLLIHEYGHVIAVKLKGYKASAPLFIPFLGAVIFAPRMKDRNDEAFVGIGGPILGSIAAIIVFIIWYFFIEDKTSELSTIILMTSYIGIFINLFNLVPISPLDGGRVTQAIGPWFKYIGITLLVIFTLLAKNPGLLLIWILVISDMNSLSVKARFFFSSITWLIMVILFLLGYGRESLLLNIVDVILGLIVALPIIIRLFAKNISINIEDDEIWEKSRKELSKKEKTQWFFYYISLTIILIGILYIEIPYLPSK